MEKEDYTINDQIEALDGPAYDFPLSILKGEHPIISVKTFIYGFNHYDKWLKYHDLLLADDYSKLVKINKLINKSPLLDYPFVVFRGIRNREIKVGDVLVGTSDKFPLLFTTLSLADAEWYAFHDTSLCYSSEECSIDIHQAVFRKEGLVLRILVPARTHFLEITSFAGNDIDNETIFDSHTKLLVTAIDYPMIDCTIYS